MTQNAENSCKFKRAAIIRQKAAGRIAMSYCLWERALPAIECHDEVQTGTDREQGSLPQGYCLPRR